MEKLTQMHRNQHREARSIKKQSNMIPPKEKKYSLKIDHKEMEVEKLLHKELL